MTDISDLIEEGKQFEGKRKFADAIAVYSRALINAIDNNDSRISEILNFRGIAKRGNGAYDDAHSDYVLAISNSKDNKQLALGYVNIADINRVHHNDIKAAHVSLDEALRFAELGSYEFLKVHDQRGLVFKAENKIPEAIKTYEDAAAAFRTSSFKDGQSKDSKDTVLLYAKILHQIGVVYSDLNDDTLLEKIYNIELKAFVIFKKFENNSGMMNSISTIGNVYRRRYEIGKSQADLENSLKSYKAALDYAGSEDKRAITGLTLEIANAYLAKNEIKNADPYIKRFIDGILNNDITSHDILLLRNTFCKISDSYQRLGLEVNGFKEVEENFRQIKK